MLVFINKVICMDVYMYMHIFTHTQRHVTHIHSHTLNAYAYMGVSLYRYIYIIYPLTYMHYIFKKYLPHCAAILNDHYFKLCILCTAYGSSLLNSC